MTRIGPKLLGLAIGARLISGSPPVAAIPPPRPWEIAHGVVVDLPSRREVRTLLAQDGIWNEADDGIVAYEHVRANGIDRSTERVVAYDIASGRKLWERPVARCYLMVAAPAGAFCDHGATELTLLDRATGAERALSTGVPNDVSAIQLVGSKVAVIAPTSSSSSHVIFFDATTGAPAGALDVPLAKVARAEGGMLCGTSVSGGTVGVACFDGSPHVVLSTSARLPDATYVMADSHDALFTRSSSDGFGLPPAAGSPAESVVLSLDDGRVVARVPTYASCLVRDDHGRLGGLLRLSRRGATFLGLDGGERWARSALAPGGDARAVLAGGLLVVASYDPSSDGVALEAFDARSGAPRWKADVELLMISHFAYETEIDLSAAYGAILLRGRETMQDYLELFDPGTGRRLLATVRAR
jgi:hypothetical protein